MARPEPVIPVERIAGRIHLIRGEKVMIGSDLAQQYGVPTSSPNQQVRRNSESFPDDFIFQLTPEEFDALMSHTHVGRGLFQVLCAPGTDGEVGALLCQFLRNSAPEVFARAGYQSHFPFESESKYLLLLRAALVKLIAHRLAHLCH